MKIMENAIEIKGLLKKYGKCVAVNGIDLAVKSGELFALLGENGAGKTTTIKVLCALTGYDSGEVKVCGYDERTQADEIRKIVNISPQETAVATKLTVKENLQLTARLYGISDEKEKTENALAAFNLKDSENKLAKNLSGGMQRRLSLVMALVSEPKVLFLDEPTLGLDVRARRELWKEIVALKGKITIILTTHYLEEAEALSDRVAIMKKGNILALGTAEEIKSSVGETSFEEAFLKITEEKI